MYTNCGSYKSNRKTLVISGYVKAITFAKYPNFNEAG